MALISNIYPEYWEINFQNSQFTKFANFTLNSVTLRWDNEFLQNVLCTAEI